MSLFPRLLLPVVLAGLALPALSLAALARVDKVSAVVVTFDMSAVTNKAAALRFTHIADDLKNAISALIVDRLADEGARIGIDISEVELSHSFTEATGAADRRREGIVVGVLGAVAGAVIGNSIERFGTREEAVEILLQLPSGERRALVQAKGNETFVPGEAVILVSTGGKTRVMKAR